MGQASAPCAGGGTKRRWGWYLSTMPPFALYLDASPLLAKRTAASKLVRFFAVTMRAVMPFRRLRVRQFYVRLVCALLAGLLPMVLGLAIIVWQTATGGAAGCGGAAATCQADV